MIRETDKYGVLTPATMEEVKEAGFPRNNDYQIAWTQHRADVEKVEAIENPYKLPVIREEADKQDGFREAIAAVLKALGQD